MNEELFTMIPNYFIWDYKGGDSLMRVCGEKTLLMIEYLYSRTSRFNTTFFTIEDMILKMGYKPKSGKNGINEEMKKYLILFEKNGIISNLSKEIKKVNIKDTIECELNLNLTEGFFKLNIEYVNKILEEETNNNVAIGMLNVLCYILARIKKRDKELKPGCEGYNAEATWFSMEDGCYDMGLEKKTFQKYLNRLVDIGIVCYANIGQIRRNGTVKTANNVYALSEDELVQGLKASKYYYESEHWKVLNRKMTRVTRQINGIKGRIKQLKEEGYDTWDLEEKLSKLEKKLTV